MSHSSHNKIGFWPVFALVTGSQIGSGILMLPANLAPFGLYSLGGWFISCVAAIALALVFARLCAWLPQTGGPHVYVRAAFGESAALFTGWTYWIISWVSSTAVVVASISYLTPLIGPVSKATLIGLEILLVIAITLLNFRGVQVAGRIEFFLTVLKFVPLTIIPLIAVWYFNVDNFVTDPSVAQLPVSQLLSRISLLTFWGFIGLESATTPAGSVENPGVTIPRAVVAGTVCVALLYIVNSFGIMGIIPGAALMSSAAPYADAVRTMFGGNWHLVVSVVASIICIGTLNAWMLASGQIILGLAQDGLVPAFFGKTNQYDAPVLGLTVSCIGIIPLLFLTADPNVAQQMFTIIDFSVIAFLYIYAICCAAFFKMLFTKHVKSIFFPLVYGTVAVAFCAWVIGGTPLATNGVALLFVASGLPCYVYYLCKKS